jgi:hypothetical protein
MHDASLPAPSICKFAGVRCPGDKRCLITACSKCQSQPAVVSNASIIDVMRRVNCVATEFEGDRSLKTLTKFIKEVAVIPYELKKKSDVDDDESEATTTAEATTASDDTGSKMDEL